MVLLDTCSDWVPGTREFSAQMLAVGLVRQNGNDSFRNSSQMTSGLRQVDPRCEVVRREYALDLFISTLRMPSILKAVGQQKVTQHCLAKSATKAGKTVMTC